MGNPKKEFNQFNPNHYGTQPRDVKTNKGRKMSDKSNENPDYVPPKG